MNKKIKLAYRILEEAERMIPVKDEPQLMQASEKVWAAFAQATKAYKHWRTERGYSSVISELYSKYPKYKDIIRNAHITARYLHSDGFYEGIASPTKEDIEIVKKAIGILDRIIGDESEELK